MAPERSTEAPQQHKQPSRKGKRAWRKHVDVSDVQAGLEEVREEVIKGGILADKPSDALFAFDTTGSSEIQAAYNKIHKPLKSDQILAQRSAIPAVGTHKRPLGVTDGIIQLSSKRRKVNGISPKEYERLREVAYGKQSVSAIIKRDEDALALDPWGENILAEEDPRFDYLERPKPIRAPATLKEPPVSLAVGATAVPAVPRPRPGTSYNPVFEDWDALLISYGVKEVEAEKKRLTAAQAEQELAERITLAEKEAEREGAYYTEDESAWEGFETDHENPDTSDKKRPERKTPQERKKVERRKERERKEKAAMKEREKAKWERRVEEWKVELDRKAKEKNKRNQEVAVIGKEQDEENDIALRRKRFGKERIPEAPLELVLPDELQDSLRLLKPEGNLLKDRYRNFLVRGKMEMRKPISQPKKKRRKATDKWTYKDFRVPV